MTLPVHYIDYFKWGILGAFFLVLLIQLIFYYVIYLKVLVKRRNVQKENHPISVIICARNEAENLLVNLPSILEQKHTDYEVIVVNDCSTDNTEKVINEFTKKYKHLRSTVINPDIKFSHGKKLAVTLGIKAAKNEWLVFTDADCKADSDQWLNRLQEHFTEDKQIVLGYGGYERRRGLLNAYIRYDTMMIALQYLGFALSGMPYMGVGRNLAYRKSLFFKNKGFARHYDLQSGDDDLFVNETATKKNVAVVTHAESHTTSIPKLSRKEWFRQKKRHFTTAGKYKPKHKLFLSLEPISRLFFYLFFGILAGLNISAIFVAGAFAFRLLSQLIILKLAMNKLKIKGILLFLIIFDVISLFINFNIYLSMTVFSTKKTRWK